MLDLLIPAVFLFIFGLFNLLGINQSYFFNQLLNAGIGIGGFIIMRRIGKHFFKLNAVVFYWIFLILLIFTSFFGPEIKGSRRWIDLYVFNFQSSEFFKIFFIIYLAERFASVKKYQMNFIFFLNSLLLFAIPTLIVFKQPDLGNALVYTAVFFTLFIFSGFPRSYFALLMMGLMVAIPLGGLLLKDYQKTRLLTFLNPQVDQLGAAYNMTQAIITIGSGKLLGKGLGLGTQSQLYFLPENHTDFAFASLVEQFGFMGGFTVIILYLILALMVIKRILTFYYQRDGEARFRFYYTLGFFAFFVFQTFVNIGMNLGIMPITGITLPLISYGGSSLITLIIGLAFIL